MANRRTLAAHAAEIRPSRFVRNNRQEHPKDFGEIGKTLRAADELLMRALISSKPQAYPYRRTTATR
jgi:hypothetical protein